MNFLIFLLGLLIFSLSPIVVLAGEKIEVLTDCSIVLKTDLAKFGSIGMVRGFHLNGTMVAFQTKSSGSDLVSIREVWYKDENDPKSAYLVRTGDIYAKKLLDMQWAFGPQAHGRSKGQGDYPYLVLRVLTHDNKDQLLVLYTMSNNFLISSRSTPAKLKKLLPGSTTSLISFETERGQKKALILRPDLPAEDR